MADSMSIDKKDPQRPEMPEREGSEDSMDSTPEAEIGAPQENAVAQQKRKGGRKPVRYGLVLPSPPYVTDENIDICYLGGTETTKPSSPSSFQGT
jgi:hypothetical protein